MDILKSVREKFELSKGIGRAEITQLAKTVQKSSTAKHYPLKNQDQNRLVQIMHRESFSSSDIYTTNLHRGILNDWLGEFAKDGVILLPSTSILSIANAALWNSRVRFNNLLGVASESESGEGTSSDPQRLCLMNFSATGHDVTVLDTRLPGAIPSQATCIQTVLGDDLTVTVYHKLAAGPPRQLASGRIGLMKQPPLNQPGHNASLSVPVSLGAYRALKHCYDLPPSLVHTVLQQAWQACHPDRESRPVTVAAAKCFWVNNTALPAFWAAGDVPDVVCNTADAGDAVSVYLCCPGAGDPWDRTVMYAEFVATVPSPIDAVADLWELRSAWVPDATPPSRTANDTHESARRILVVGAPDLAVRLGATKALSHFTVAHSSLQDITLPDKLTHVDVIAVLLPNSADDGTDAVLRGALDTLQTACQANTRIILLSHESSVPANAGLPALGAVSGSAACEVTCGAVLSAQLEYLKCRLTVCRVVGASTTVTTDALAEALAMEVTFTSDRVETEVLYAALAASPTDSPQPLQRNVRRYERVPSNASAPLSATVSSDEGVFVVTGGLGGLGLLTARCLIRGGARKVVLLSRSGKVPYPGQGLEDQLQGLLEFPGAQVVVIRCDVSVETEVVRMLVQARSMGPIVGIIHAAGVLSDGLIVTGKASRGASTVWAAKAHGAYLLHKHTTSDAKLRMFLCYSSVTAAVGTAGQSAYGSANRYLEWLMHQRVLSGQPGQCVRWPEVTGIGMAAALHGANGDHDRSCAISAAQAEAFLSDLLCKRPVGAVNETTVTLMPPALAKLYAETIVGKQFAQLLTPTCRPSATAATESEPTSLLPPAPPRAIPSEAQVLTAVRRIVASLLDEAVGDDSLLMQAGLDSLGATELSGQLGAEFKIKVPPTLIFNYPTVREIAGYLQAALAQSALSVPAVSQPRSLPLRGVPLERSANNATATQAGAVVGQNVVTLDDVAIIGTSLSFPGNCSSLERLREILLNKESTSVKTPADRWDVDALLAANNIRDASCRARLQSAHFLTHEEPFNCVQFNMTAKEAAAMHPTHRLLLINCLRALEDAGYAGANLCTNTGVYVGIGGVVSGTGSAAAPTAGAPSQSGRGQATMSAYSATSNTISVSAGRISFALGLSGPCMAIDTACSSSLVALHAARRALQLGECDLALVCGVNCLDASSSLACAVAAMTSPDGLCRTFDGDANGYSRAEGCGVVVLKRLGDAMRYGDAVHCVVRGSAVKQDGKSASLTAPNGRAQQELLHAALKDARLQPDDLQLLEAHGTGTKLGDPVEAAALSTVFGVRPATAPPLLLTAVKANVGHLEAGAGMAGLFSIMLALQHRTAPPNALLRTLNKEVCDAIGDASIVPITSATPLARVGSQPLVAGVSSFGYSGTIAHVILQEAPEEVRHRNIHREGPSTTTTALTLVERWTPTNVTSTVVAQGPSATFRIAMTELEESSDDDCDTVSSDGAVDQVWQFAGQGDIRVGAGRELYETEEAFRSAMAECDRIVRPLLGRTISEMLYPPDCESGAVSKVGAPQAPKSAALQAAEAVLAQTVNAQVTLVALEYCLAAVWLAQEVTPDIVLGHSLGEYAAAVVAGVLTLQDALRLVCERGRLVQENTGCRGVMYAVRATAEDVAAALQRADAATLAGASLAACNGRQSCVLSGSEAAVQKLISLLPRVGSIRLGVSHAFHSPLMRCIEAPFRTVLSQVRFSPLKEGVQFVSTVRGRVVNSAELADGQYWVDHMLLPVQYVDAVQCAWQLGGRTFLEMGPQDTLTKLSKRILDDLSKAATATAGRDYGDDAYECMASLS